MPRILSLAVALTMAMPAFAAPVVSDATVRLPAVSGRPAACYVMVTSDKADALTGVTSPQAGRIEMHSTKAENGMMRMRQETSMAVPARGMLHMAPGSAHLMLFDLAAGLQPGGTLPLTLSFQSGAKVTVDAKLVAAGAPMEKQGASHQHH